MAGTATRTYVLVHGGWHGGWHWDDVADRLRATGATVYAPTLVGLAERVGEATATTGVQDHVADVVALIDNQGLADVVLVGHSYGGFVITGVAHARPAAVSDLVYLDAFVPTDGQSPAQLLGDDVAQMARDAARAAGTPHLVPPLFSVEANTGWTGARADELERRMCSQPLGTFFQPLDAKGEISARRAFISCSELPLGLFHDVASHARDAADWRYFELPSPHDAVHVMPAAVAGVLASFQEA